MTQSLVQGIIDALSGSVGKEAIVFIISMIPILELRGALLVAGPLLGVPGTGAWTGSLIAALLGVKFKKAFPAIIIGICMATVIMWFISYVLLGGVQILG